MKTLTYYLFLIIIFPCLLHCTPPSFSEENLPSEGDTGIIKILKPIARAHGLPAMGAALITNSGLAKIGVVGVRQAGRDNAVTLDDRWHLGSCAKAMCATVAAKLVELEQLKWDTQIKDIFPELAADFQSNLGEATILHLLTHTAGLPRDTDYHKLKQIGSPKEQRLQALINAGSKKTEYAIGKKHSYSNLSYVLTGAIIERITGKTYESVMKDYLFEPLEMQFAEFECVNPIKDDQLWSHDEEGNPVEISRFCHNDAPALRPAGCVRCTLEDWSKFIRLHLLGAQGQSDFLNPSTFERLHTAIYNDEYALGWVITKRDWGGGKVLHHAGSNTFNFANTWVAPNKQFALMVVTNQGGSFKATDEAAGALIEWHHQ